MEVFHSCRPRAVDSYLTKGLLPSNSALLDAQAAWYLFGDEPSSNQLSALAVALEKLGVRDDGKLFVSTDFRFVVQHAGHYLIYGSERILCFAACLGYAEDAFRARLRTIGRPTVFKAKLLWSSMDESDIAALSEAICKEIPRIRKRRDPRLISCAFTLHQRIPPCDLIEVIHPTGIRDPHNQMKVYGG